MLKLYILHASSRLACRDIQRIQRIQRIQLYSYTRYTAYSTIQPPSGLSFEHTALVCPQPRRPPVHSRVSIREPCLVLTSGTSGL